MKRASARVKVLSAASALASLLVCSPRAEAQITVPASTLPVVGDTLKVAVDNSPGACAFTTFTPPGGGQTWDLSCLTADSTQDIVHRPTIVGSVNVPGATSVVLAPAGALSSLSTQEEYYTTTGASLSLSASYGTVPGLLSNAIFFLHPVLPLRSAPLNFFDIRAAATGILQSFNETAFAPGWLAQLPFTADSLRVRVAINEIAVVDAWGSMTIPGGTFDVLREKRTRYTETRMDAKVNPLGWLDVTDSIITFTGAQYLGVDTLVHHNYYNDVAKEPIASLQWNTAQNAVVKATFKRVAPVCQNDGDPCGDPSSSACNLADTCLAGACVPNLLAAGTACGSGATSACTSPDTCDGAGACVLNDTANGTACSDGSQCTIGDSCQNGACIAGAPPNCNDGNACTIDSCNPATGCVSAADPVCVPPISVLSAVQQVESCAPANGVLDPDERVTYAVTLRNNGTQPTTNLVATLLASAGVSGPSKAQNYGVIPAGGSATRSFTWTGVGACGAAWSAALALADGGQALPGVTVAGTYGTPGGVCNAGCAVVRIATKTTLRRNADGSVRATVTVSNTGSVQATNVVLTRALLGTDSGTPLPQPAGPAPNTIQPGQSKTVTVTFPASVLAGGNVLRLGGTYTGGTFSNSLRVTVP